MTWAWKTVFRDRNSCWTLSLASILCTEHSVYCHRFRRGLPCWSIEVSGSEPCNRSFNLSVPGRWATIRNCWKTCRSSFRLDQSQNSYMQKKWPKIKSVLIFRSISICTSTIFHLSVGKELFTCDPWLVVWSTGSTLFDPREKNFWCVQSTLSCW